MKVSELVFASTTQLSSFVKGEQQDGEHQPGVAWFICRDRKQQHELMQRFSSLAVRYGKTLKQQGGYLLTVGEEDQLLRTVKVTLKRK